MPATLYLVSVPVGNVEDITLRAIHILQRVSVVAAENPEQMQALFDRHQIHTPVTSYHRGVQEEKTAILIHRLQAGQDVALVPDEGTPCICDPGTYLVSKARAAGIPIVPVPGPSALLAALAVSGFKGGFTFVGDLPKTPEGRLRLLRSFRRSAIRILIFFVPAGSLVALLHELDRTFGNPRVLIARDMTKPGEYFFHGPIATALKAWTAGPVGGDLTLIVEGKRKRIKAPLSFE